MTGYLRRARIAAGMNQRELGAAAGLDASTVSLCERNKARASAAALRRMEDALARGLLDQLEEIKASQDELQRVRSREAEAPDHPTPDQELAIEPPRV